MVGDGQVSRRAVLMATGGLVAGLAAGAAAGCSRQPEADDTDLYLATGPAGAVYRRIGGAVAEHINQKVPGVSVTTVTSGASTDNIRMLLAGDVHLGLSSLDAVITAEGDVPEGLAAVCRLYDSHLHLVVMADSPITEFADLAGARISLGAHDSGTEFTSRRVLDLSGIPAETGYRSQAASAMALRDGDIDAMFSLTGVPTPAITDLAAEYPIRLIPLDEQAGDLVAAYPGPYAPATITPTAYVGVTATRTVAVPNVLLARTDLPDDVVYAVTDTVFTRTRAITANSQGEDALPQAWQINLRTGISTGSIPLHDGARAWFRDQKP